MSFGPPASARPDEPDEFVVEELRLLPGELGRRRKPIHLDIPELRGLDPDVIRAADFSLVDLLTPDSEGASVAAMRSAARELEALLSQAEAILAESFDSEADREAQQKLRSFVEELDPAVAQNRARAEALKGRIGDVKASLEVATAQLSAATATVEQLQSVLS
jgi:hypothetical protein